MNVPSRIRTDVLALKGPRFADFCSEVQRMATMTGNFRLRKRPTFHLNLDSRETLNPMKRLLSAALMVATVACSGKDNPVGNSGAPPPPPVTSTGTLSGTVSSAAGGPISGATVSLEGSTSLQTTTNGSGQYTFPSLAFAGYTLRSRHPNYAEKAQGVTFTSSQTVNVTLLPLALWTRSGFGNQVFDMPTYFPRVHVQGSWNRSSNSNFIVYIGGHLVINEILRQTINYDGTHLTGGGGIVEIVDSGNISWTLTEIR